MKVIIQFEVVLHRDGPDNINSGAKTKGTSFGVESDRSMLDGVLLELKPAFESLQQDVHAAVLRRYASDVLSRTIAIGNQSRWRKWPPTAEEVRDYPWWWNRSPAGTLHVLHLETKIGSDIIIDVEESAAHDCGARFDPDVWPGEWAVCAPPGGPVSK